MKTIGAVVERAQQLIREARYGDAKFLLDDAIQENPISGELLEIRAVVLHAQAEWQQALADAEQAMALMPLTVAGQLVLGDAYAFTGHRELALCAYEHLLKQPSLPLDYFAGLYAGFRRCGRVDLALHACRRAVETDPDNHEAYFGMAHCMASLVYSADHVASVLETACDLAPHKPIYRISLVLQLMRSGKHAPAYDQLTRVAPEELQKLSCKCAAKQLLHLCESADDHDRCAALCVSIDRLS